MAHPLTHADSSARRFGGRASDYLPIHELMDSSKAAFPDNRHRALTHNSWFIFVVERVFGPDIPLTNDAGDEVGRAKTRYVAEQHILEDFGGKFIPTASDYLEGLEFQPWINNGVEGSPSSHRKLASATKTTTRRAFTLD